jgi:LacI family transcriptional regulator
MKTTKKLTKPRKAVTLNDVALASGVSHQTVSRVINNSPNVSDPTRNRVRQAIRELGYRPNRAARQLVTGTSMTIGIISYGMNYYGPAQMVQRTERALTAQGYGLVFASVDDLEPASLQRAIDALEQHAAAGFILVTPLLAASLADIPTMCRGVPYVLVDAPPEVNMPSVRIDQAAGSMLATQHLLELGHNHICEISGPLSWSGGRGRHQAWRDTLQQAGVTPGRSIESDWTAQGGYDAALELARDPSSAAMTALVVGNDQMALGAIAALRDFGLRVPADVSVVGFDDVPEAQFFDPPLTTVVQQFDALGEQSAAYILERVGAKPAQDHDQHVTLQPRLVVRKSTVKPPRAAKRKPPS